MWRVVEGLKATLHLKFSFVYALNGEYGGIIYIYIYIIEETGYRCRGGTLEQVS